jgi:hypothetical protein
LKTEHDEVDTGKAAVTGQFSDLVGQNAGSGDGIAIEGELGGAHFVLVAAGVAGRWSRRS